MHYTRNPQRVGNPVEIVLNPLKFQPVSKRTLQQFCNNTARILQEHCNNTARTLQELAAKP
jgi:hypothetical protein